MPSSVILFAVCTFQYCLVNSTLSPLPRTGVAPRSCAPMGEPTALRGSLQRGSHLEGYRPSLIIVPRGRGPRGGGTQFSLPPPRTGVAPAPVRLWGRLWRLGAPSNGALTSGGIVPVSSSSPAVAAAGSILSTPPDWRRPRLRPTAPMGALTAPRGPLSLQFPVPSSAAPGRSGGSPLPSPSPLLEPGAGFRPGNVRVTSLPLRAGAPRCHPQLLD